MEGKNYMINKWISYKISVIVWTDENQWPMIYDIVSFHLSESLCMLLFIYVET